MSSRRPQGRDIREKEVKNTQQEDQHRKLEKLHELVSRPCPKCQTYMRIKIDWDLADENEVWIFCLKCYTADTLQKVKSFDFADYYNKFKDNYNNKLKEEADNISAAFRQQDMPWSLFLRDYIHYLKNRILIMSSEDFEKEFLKAIFYE